MRRILSVRLPHWPIARYRLARRKTGAPPPDGVAGPPFALVAAGAHGPVLHDRDRGAGEAGLHAGMRLADARALCPDLRTAAADPGGDRAALARLARWCTRWSPWTATDGADGILIDISGCTHLFGGEAALCDDLAGRLARMGIPARTAIADTIGAAHALARHGAQSIAPPGEDALRAALAGLPVAALRIDAESAAMLKRLGLKRIGQLYDLPRASLARRFGRGGMREADAVLHRLDQALGRVFEPLDPLLPVPRWRVHRSFPEPVTDNGALDRLLAPLCDALAARLEADGQGARRLSLGVFRVDGTRQDVRIGTHRPSRDAAHLQRLFRERLPMIDPGFGIDLMILAADVVAPLAPAQADLTGRATEDLALAALVDRLALRLGTAHIGRIAPHESHVPERAERRLCGLSAPSWTDAPRPPGPVRPVRLLPRPEPIEVMAEVPEGPPRAFRWRRRRHRVTRAQGPERIAPEWWHDQGAAAAVRDYYRIEDEAGRRFWVFRAGLYGAAAAPGAPRWFLHGLFA